MLTLEVIGNLGADATIKEFSGQKFIAFNVAHTESYPDSQGNKHERTTWVSCLKFGESGVINYLKKGTRVFVRGDLSVRTYETNNSVQAGVNCRVRELQLLGSRADAQGQSQQPTGQTTTSQNWQQPTPTENPFPPSSNDTDDLPF